MANPLAVSAVSQQHFAATMIEGYLPDPTVMCMMPP